MLLCLICLCCVLFSYVVCLFWVCFWLFVVVVLLSLLYMYIYIYMLVFVVGIILCFFIVVRWCFFVFLRVCVWFVVVLFFVFVYIYIMYLLFLVLLCFSFCFLFLFDLVGCLCVLFVLFVCACLFVCFGLFLFVWFVGCLFVSRVGSLGVLRSILRMHVCTKWMNMQCTRGAELGPASWNRIGISWIITTKMVCLLESYWNNLINYNNMSCLLES